MSAISIPAVIFPKAANAMPALLPASADAIDQVVVINDASVAKGGATGMVLEMLRHLDERGLKTIFICGDDGIGFSSSATRVEPLRPV